MKPPPPIPQESQGMTAFFSDIPAYTPAPSVAVDPVSAVRRRARLEKLATFLDDRFTIPGTSIRFGFDSIIGLIPGVGDLITGALSLYIVFLAYRLGFRGSIIFKMLGNVAIDVILGEVLIVGDIADIFFRANRRNLALLGIRPEWQATRMQSNPLRPFVK